MQKFKISAGDIIIASVEGVPVLEHAGIVVFEAGNVFVWHNVPGKGILKENLREFLSTRSMIGVRKTNQTPEKITDKINQVINKKYHLFNYNCFDFVREVTSEM